MGQSSGVLLKEVAAFQRCQSCNKGFTVDYINKLTACGILAVSSSYTRVQIPQW